MNADKKSIIAAARKRILIVDDHPMTRQGMSQLLGREADLAVCGEVANVAQAQAALRKVRPNLVLTDITLPGKGGLEFVQEMTHLHPGLPLLVVSMHDEAIYAERALQAGARGYIMKSEGGEDLLTAVRQVLRGEIYVSKKMSTHLLGRITGRQLNRPGAAISNLTQREFEVIQLIGQGLGTREIAQHLHLSGKTVETYRAHLKEKLGLPTRAKLTAYAVRWAAANQLI